MKILMINVVCGIRSTGRICTDLASSLEAQGHEVKIAYGRETVPKAFSKYAVRIGEDRDVYRHVAKARLHDGMGLGSKYATKKFVRWVEEFNPDIIHIHNIHGYYVNIKVLFEYLRKCGKKIIWTMHDCWAFTGHCTYFDYEKCDGWMRGCGNCPQKDVYPKRIGRDLSRRNFALKQDLFTGIDNMTIVTPSQWLADLDNKSFMAEYPTVVINNGVDTNVFKPVDSTESIKRRYNLVGKTVILGVAAVWDRRKGLEDFIELSKRLDESYSIVLVGLTAKQVDALPSNIIGIERTRSISELVDIYCAADVLVNPTREDNYPTVNLEAIACGTPVITYNTGGSPESANIYGMTLRNNTVDEIIDSLRFIKTFKRKDVDISKDATIEKYLALYSK